MNLIKLFTASKKSKHSDRSSKPNTRHRFTSPTGKKVETQMMKPEQYSVQRMFRAIHKKYSLTEIKQNSELSWWVDTLLMHNQDDVPNNHIFNYLIRKYL